MTQLHIEPADEKNLRVTGIDPLLAGSLCEVPRVLEQRDQSPSRDRLYPDLFRADAPANDDWHRLMDDDLRHLFVSAGETVERDLTRLEPDPAHKDCVQLLLPAAHVNAWMSALNQARLVLAEQFAITEADMTNEDLDPRRDQDLAVFSGLTGGGRASKLPAFRRRGGRVVECGGLENR
jgi:Domain of unknown function (DUF2017)